MNLILYRTTFSGNPDGLLSLHLTSLRDARLQGPHPARQPIALHGG